jgi:hypothetical protein
MAYAKPSADLDYAWMVVRANAFIGCVRVPMSPSVRLRVLPVKPGQMTNSCQVSDHVNNAQIWLVI